jgi:D-aminopeptidase
MTRDVAVVVRALFDAGAAWIRVNDFHRTGYNLLPEMIDPRAKVVSGYRAGPVRGIGDPAGAQGALFLGMHAASGSRGFLAHTLTSRIADIEVNGRRLAEIELFAASLAPFGVRPVFLSGCPTACAQAETAIPGIRTYPIEKRRGAEGFDARGWRRGLVEAAARSLGNTDVRPFVRRGPLHTVVTLRDGKAAARRLGMRWDVKAHGPKLFFTAADMDELYHTLIRLCYLTPLAERTLPISLLLYHIIGRAGLAWVRRGIKADTRVKRLEMNN